jgi:hypothetical protein
MLSYESASKVSASAVVAIFKEIELLDRVWWRGVLGFDASDEGRPALLFGRTSLFHTQGIPDEDDLFMAFADAVFILDQLSRWARKHRIKWRVRMHDEDWGAVDPGGLTKPLFGHMEKWARRVQVFSSGRDAWFVPEDRRAALLARHAGRKEV